VDGTWARVQMAKPENGGACFKIDRGIKAVIQAGALYNARRHRIPSLRSTLAVQGILGLEDLEDFR
jgi:hypothetical protein